MDFLLEKGFLASKMGNPSGKVYYTTKKGEKFLKDIKNVLCQVG